MCVLAAVQCRGTSHFTPYNCWRNNGVLHTEQSCYMWQEHMFWLNFSMFGLAEGALLSK